MADDQIPLKEGFLWFFAGNGVLGQSEESWQKKYCRLFRRSEAGLNRVEVFKDEKIDFPEHVISLEGCLAVSKGQSHQLTFFVAKESKQHYFRVDSIGEQNEWLDNFRRVAFQKKNVERTVPMETESATAKKKKPDQELFVVKHNRSEEQQNTMNYRDLTNRVNFLIARELLKEAACGKDVCLLSKEGRIVYNKYRDVRNIFGHSREESRSNYQK